MTRPTSRRAALGALLLAFVSPLVASAPAFATPMVRIVKIHYKQSGTNLDTEYVVVKNTTGQTIHLSGWKIVSAPSSDNQHYVFPATTLGAGKTLTLYTGHGTDSGSKRYWNASSPRWDNDGDKAILRNTSGTVIDTCQYAGGGTVAYC